MIRRREDLSSPKGRVSLGIHYDPEAFGRFSESIARLLGTARFLVAQTVLVAIWITLNVFAIRLRWDPYPFILLNLAFSTQAAYAAPLILLAQTRQADRDKAHEDAAAKHRDELAANQIRLLEENTALTEQVAKLRPADRPADAKHPRSRRPPRHLTRGLSASRAYG